MNIISDRPIMIFRNDVNEKTYYRTGISKKDQQGNVLKGYIDCRFRRDANIANQTRINIIDAWMDFWKDDKKVTHPYIFINKYSLATDTQTVTQTNSEVVRQVYQQQPVQQKAEEKDPFAEFGEQVSVDDDFLE